MPKGIQKSVPRLAIVGVLALLAFNFPMLSLYRGHVMSIPVFFIGLFGAWLVVILLARLAAEPLIRHMQHGQQRQERNKP